MSIEDIVPPCKDCLYYVDCDTDSEFPCLTDRVMERLNNIFVDGYDCFCIKRGDD